MLIFEWTVLHRLNVSIVESRTGLDFFNRSCSCAKTLRFLLHIEDVKPYENNVCSLDQRYEQRVTDRNGNEFGKKMHDAKWYWTSKLN